MFAPHHGEGPKNRTKIIFLRTSLQLQSSPQRGCANFGKWVLATDGRHLLADYRANGSTQIAQLRERDILEYPLCFQRGSTAERDEL
jgi:hypothetical protein